MLKSLPVLFALAFSVTTTATTALAEDCPHLLREDCDVDIYSVSPTQHRQHSIAEGTAAYGCMMAVRAATAECEAIEPQQKNLCLSGGDIFNYRCLYEEASPMTKPVCRQPVCYAWSPFEPWYPPTGETLPTDRPAICADPGTFDCETIVTGIGPNGDPIEEVSCVSDTYYTCPNADPQDPCNCTAQESQTIPNYDPESKMAVCYARKRDGSAGGGLCREEYFNNPPLPVLNTDLDLVE
ncbi:hypothetical protein MRY87_06555 [bacterium]|nr:hypothetical protein [bacterium]